jgi:hypothetical protein
MRSGPLAGTVWLLLGSEKMIQPLVHDPAFVDPMQVSWSAEAHTVTGSPSLIASVRAKRMSASKPLISEEMRLEAVTYLKLGRPIAATMATIVMTMTSSNIVNPAAG